MTHVLAMAALEFGHPVAVRILMERHDPPLHLPRVVAMPQVRRHTSFPRRRARARFTSPAVLLAGRRGRGVTRPSRTRARARFTTDDYREILRFRTRIRRSLAWSGAQARAAGITPAQHQLLLAIRGHGDPEGPSIGDIADYLQLRHHAAVGLVDRAEAAGLVRRAGDEQDRRVARVQLCPAGTEILEQLTALHVAELRALASGNLLPDLPAEVGDEEPGGHSGV